MNDAMRGSWKSDEGPPDPDGLPERLIITGGAFVAILYGVVVGLCLADYLYS